MPPRLITSPLAAARGPLDGLRLRGWAHGGRLTLAGLLMDLRTTPPDWRTSVRPWLDAAAEVRRHDDLLLVLFAEPLLLDCAALGPFVGVTRHGTCLTAAPFAEPEPALAAHVRDRLVHVRAGALRAVSLSAFETLDVAGWWSLDGIDIVPGRAVPALARPKLSRPISAPSVPPDPDADAVFATLRHALAEKPRRGLRAAGADLRFGFAHLLRRVMSGVFVFAIVASLIGLVAALIVYGGLIIPIVTSFFESLSPHELGAPVVPPWIVVPVLAGLVGAILEGSRPAGSSGGSGWLRGAFRRLTRGFGRAKPASSSGSAIATNPRRPLWRRLGAWLAWHSPLGASIRRRYAERVLDIERLFAAGRLDEALRKALKLGGDGAPAGAFGDLPLTGPGLRERIELDLSGRATRAFETLQGDEQQRLKALYRLHAHDLAKAGDIERGAFILAELLNAPAEAARLLADHGRFETAARLGEARRLAPTFVIPLWFKAGDAARALALAARHDLFAELWKEVHAGDPFRDRLAEAWCERLADIGAYERAADISRGVAILAERRSTWIFRAVESGEKAPTNALARALVALTWRPDSSDRLFIHFRALLAEPGEPGAARRLAVAGHLVDPGFEPRRDADAGAGFRLLSHELTRRLAADEAAHGHLPRRAGMMAALAESGRHHALRHDLRKLAKVPKPKAAEPVRRMVIEAGPPLAAIADAVLLADGRVLIGYSSGLLRLLGLGGRELWRGQANGLIGFVLIGEGRRTLVLRRVFDELLAMVFAADERRLEPWGALPITAWHPHATETGWPVFGEDGGFTMLDTACLLREPGDDGEPPLSHHWSIPMSEPGRPLALLRSEREAVLVHARFDGLVEWWSVDLRTLKVDCRFWSAPPALLQASDTEPGAFAVAGLDTIDTFIVAPEVEADGKQDGRVRDGEDAHAVMGLRHLDHVFASAERRQELALLAAAANEPRHAFGSMASLNGNGCWAARGLDKRLVWCGRASRSAPTWIVEAFGSKALNARFSTAGSEVVIHDDQGRLIVLDLADDNVRLVMK